MDYIVNASHYAARFGGKSGKDWIQHQQKKHRQQGILVSVLNIDNPMGEAVRARVNGGTWIADCVTKGCGGAEFVDPSFPSFFCWGCGNKTNGGNCRPVIFPENREEIEKLLLDRPVETRGLDELSAAYNAAAVLHVQLEEVEAPTEIEMMSALGGVMPEIRKTINTYPLQRNWLPTETIDDLRKQNKPVEKWHAELKKDNK